MTTPADAPRTPSGRRVVDAAITLAVGDIYDPRAFSALLDAVRRHLGAAESMLLDSRRAVIPFGRWKNTPVNAVPLSELESMAAYLHRALCEPAKAAWKGSNLVLLAAVRAEVARRSELLEEAA